MGKQLDHDECMSFGTCKQFLYKVISHILISFEQLQGETKDFLIEA